jgi:hypothetical protein
MGEIRHAGHCEASKTDGVRCTCGIRTNQEDK